jgi:hypothetical protein
MVDVAPSTKQVEEEQRTTQGFGHSYSLIWNSKLVTPGPEPCATHVCEIIQPPTLEAASNSDKPNSSL